MAGYDTKYGEEIKNSVENFNKKYISHYDAFDSMPLSFQRLQGNNLSRNPTTYFSGAVVSRGTYSGEKEAPSEITQKEADKEAEFEGGFMVRRGIPKPNTQRERNRKMIEAEANRIGLKSLASGVKTVAELAKNIPQLQTGAEVVSGIADVGESLLGGMEFLSQGVPTELEPEDLRTIKGIHKIEQTKRLASQIHRANTKRMKELLKGKEPRASYPPEKRGRGRPKKGGMITSRARRFSTQRREPVSASDIEARLATGTMLVSKLRQAQKRLEEKLKAELDREASERKAMKEEDFLSRRREALDKFEEATPFIFDADDYDDAVKQLFRYYTETIRTESPESRKKEKTTFLKMISDLFGVNLGNLTRYFDEKVISKAMTDKSLESYPEYQSYLRVMRMKEAEERRATEIRELEAEAERRARQTEAEAKKERIEAKRDPVIKTLSRTRTSPKSDEARSRELGAVVPPSQTRFTGEKKKELEAYEKIIQNQKDARKAVDLPEISDDEVAKSVGLATRAEFLDSLKAKYGKGKGRPKKQIENPDVRMDDMPVKQKSKRGRPKKENTGKTDPKIEKLLGGELIMTAKQGSTMSGGRKQSDKMKKRGELVKKIMKERGVKLAEASKIIKAEGLM